MEGLAPMLDDHIGKALGLKTESDASFVQHLQTLHDDDSAKTVADFETLACEFTEDYSLSYPVT